MTKTADLFWDLAGGLLGRDGVEEGSIMSSRCLRVNGAFFAMPDHKGGGLVVKLTAERVGELIGRPFAPAGKVFREWVLVPEPDPQAWAEIRREACHLQQRRVAFPGAVASHPGDAPEG